MKILKTLAVIAVVLSVTVPVWCEEEKQEKPKVEVAFVLDTTGSMGGLIAGAKSKIWYIAEQIVSGKPTPDVKMALVPYRDKGDKYVTKVFDLTDNIDQVYEDLMGFSADGGGDGPENVNQGLYDAVHKLKWSEDPKTLKIIYLVGDYPPHNEYTDVPTYDKTAEEAIKKGIYINSILCGGNQATKKIWIEIADAAEGSFFAIGQKGDVREIPTPFDDELAGLNRKLTETVVEYGREEEQAAVRKTKAGAMGYGGGVAASKASYAITTKKIVTGKDLVMDAGEDDEELAEKLDNLKKIELPDEMKEMTKEEQKEYIQKKQVERKKISKEISELSKKRNDYIKSELKKTEGKKEGFDLKVLDSLKKQAGKKGITYEN